MRSLLPAVAAALLLATGASRTIEAREVKVLIITGDHGHKWKETTPFLKATSYSDKDKDPKNTGKDEPAVWVAAYGKGRVCENVLGHDVEAMQSAGFQVLLVRGVEWAATGEAFYPLPPELKGNR